MATLSFIRASKLVELLQSATKGGEMYVRVASANRLALGTDPMNPTISVDLAKESITPYDNAESAPPMTGGHPQVGARKAARRSGDYWVEINGKRQEAGSLREILAKGLREIEALRPGTLEKLSRIRPRSKRIVARDKTMLFDADHLSDEYGEQLMNGWWYGTNNSTQETITWLERACSCAGLTWGKDFHTSLN